MFIPKAGPYPSKLIFSYDEKGHKDNLPVYRVNSRIEEVLSGQQVSHLESDLVSLTENKKGFQLKISIVSCNHSLIKKHSHIYLNRSHFYRHEPVLKSDVT